MLNSYYINPLTIHIASHTGSEVRGEGNLMRHPSAASGSFPTPFLSFRPLSRNAAAAAALPRPTISLVPRPESAPGGRRMGLFEHAEILFQIPEANLRRNAILDTQNPPSPSGRGAKGEGYSTSKNHFSSPENQIRHRTRTRNEPTDFI